MNALGCWELQDTRPVPGPSCLTEACVVGAERCADAQLAQPHGRRVGVGPAAGAVVVQPLRNSAK